MTTENKDQETPTAPSVGGFAAALVALEAGEFVCRTCWEGMFVFMMAPSVIPLRHIADAKLREAIPGDRLIDQGNLRRVHVDTGVVTNGWLPTPADLMARNWSIYEASPTGGGGDAE
jgi:hypothetical protein